MQGVNVVKANTLCYTLAFSEAVLAALFLNILKMPNLKSYDRKGDLDVHVKEFHV